MKNLKLMGLLIIVAMVAQSCVEELVKPCPEPFFLAQQKINNNIVASAAFLGLEDETLKWYVDGDLREVVEPGEGRSNSFEVQFPKAGTYTICLLIEAEDCDEIREMCVELVIENDIEDLIVGCPKLAFDFTNSSVADYTFTADFEGIDVLDWYGWLINDEFIENEGISASGDNVLNYTFTESGTYVICIATETPECPAGAEFCKTIEVKL